MAKMKVARPPAANHPPKQRAPVSAAFQDLAIAVVELRELHERALTYEWALMGALAGAAEHKVPIDDVQGYIKPILDVLSRHAEDLDVLVQRAHNAAGRLHAAGCGA